MGSYPPISDYALIGDCHAAALVARDGSIDWCCMPRIDSGSCFARLLDRERGGFCAIRVLDEEAPPAREYVEGTMVLRSTLTSRGGQAQLVDLVAVDPREPRRSPQQLLRVVDGVRGSVELAMRVAPRFDYGDCAPWLRRLGPRRIAAFGGDDGLAVQCDVALELDGGHEITARCVLRAGDRVRLSIAYLDASTLDCEPPEELRSEQVDRRLEQTIAFWRSWIGPMRIEGPDAPGAARSALVIKALSNARTGAIAAAATTSLPEARRGGRTWDYRFTWVRDSVFAARALAEAGLEAEADAFRRFIQRTTAGHVEELRIVYGVGGERRLSELAQECERTAPLARWRRVRDEIRATVEREGCDRHGVFTQVLGGRELDAAALLLPSVGFLDWNDPRMLRTTDAIREQLGERGLVRRHASADGLKGREGAFLACSFWLAECLAHQGRVEQARTAFDAAQAAGNDLGLFSEEFDTRRRAMMGNFPQALTHLAHISATIPLAQASQAG